MNRQNSELLVMTDLNGTLLDEWGAADAAVPALQRLSDTGIPLVMNSSKAAPDIRALQQKLKVSGPLVSENGAELLLPAELPAQTPAIHRYGMPRQEILHVLAGISEEQDYAYLAFSALSEQQLGQLSGLSDAVSRLLNARRYTETLLWRDSRLALENFAGHLQQYGLICRSKGDLVMVFREVNKALPIPCLRKWFAEQYGSQPYILALGDGMTDLPMLKVANEACFLGTEVFPQGFADGQPGRTISANRGPAEWSRQVMQWLDRLLT